MKRIDFPSQEYALVDGSYLFKVTDSSLMGMFDIAWTAVQQSRLELTKAEHKINRKLKAKLREISIFKDKDKDSRIMIEAGTLLLEDAEWELLKRFVDTTRFLSIISDDLVATQELIDNASDFKPTLK